MNETHSQSQGATIAPASANNVGSMPTKPKRSQKEIEQAVKRYLAGEQVDSLAREYRVSRAGLYLWINKAKASAADAAHRQTIGPKGVAQEERINKDLLIKQLQQENERIKRKLMELLIKHNEL